MHTALPNCVCEKVEKVLLQQFGPQTHDELGQVKLTVGSGRATMRMSPVTAGHAAGQNFDSIM